MSDWYTSLGDVPATGSSGQSAPIRAQYGDIAAALDKLPALSGMGNNLVLVNAGGTALESISQSDLAALLEPLITTVDDATNAGISAPITIKHTTSGTPAIGIGVELPFEVETAAGNVEKGASIQAISTNVTNTTEAFDLALLIMVSGSLVEKARLKSGGQFDLAIGGKYQIGGADVLSASALGSSVLASSLTSLGTIASLVATTADINGGTLDGAAINASTIGAVTPSSGVFTTVVANTSVQAPIFKIGANNVLSTTVLGSTIVTSSLTSVGIITSGTWRGTPIEAGYVAGLSGTNTGDEPSATASAEGVIELATQGEVDTGTDTVRAVTPATLRNTPINAAQVDGKSVEVVTQAAYNAGPKDSATLYFIVG